MFDCLLIDNEIPINELPPCILTELLNSKEIELNTFLEETKTNKLISIYSTLPKNMAIPSKKEVMACSKGQPCNLYSSPLDVFVQSEDQSTDLYAEQMTAFTVGT